MSYLDWKVGEKVVCIDAVPRWEKGKRGNPRVVWPVEGCVYTIRQIDADYLPEIGPHIRLAEISNALQQDINRGPYEAAFNIRRFRPVIKRTTDISTLQALLLNPFVKIGEDA